MAKEAGWQASEEKMTAVAPLVRERIRLLRDLLTVADFFFASELPPYDRHELVPQKGDLAMALRVLQHAQQLLGKTAFDHASLEAALRAAADELKLKAGQMFQPIRVAVCGRKNAPPLFETLAVLGRETCLERIGRAIQMLQS